MERRTTRNTKDNTKMTNLHANVHNNNTGIKTNIDAKSSFILDAGPSLTYISQGQYQRIDFCAVYKQPIYLLLFGL